MRPVSELHHLCVIRAKTVTDNTITEKNKRIYLLEASCKEILVSNNGDSFWA